MTKLRLEIITGGSAHLDQLVYLVVEQLLHLLKRLIVAAERTVRLRHSVAASQFVRRVLCGARLVACVLSGVSVWAGGVYS